MSGQSRARILNLERIGDLFLNRLASLHARDLHDILGYLSSHRAVDQVPGVGVRGAVVDGLNVTAQTVPDLTVQISVGLALVPEMGTSGVVPTPQTNPDSNYVLLNKRLATLAQPISPPPPGAFRWDLLELAPAGTDFVDDAQIVDLYDIPGKKFVPTATPQPVMIHGEGTIVYTTGAPGGPIPAPTEGRVPIAAILIWDGMTAVTQEHIFDARIFLSESMRRGRADAASSLDVPELAIDPSDTGTPTGAQRFSLQATACVRGSSCGFSTATPLDLNLGRDFFDFCDRVTRTRIFGGTAPDWMYCYLVAQDDQGLRLSRSNVPALAGVPSGNRFSHCGMLVWSHVPPSLAGGGSLAPSAPLSLAEVMGNGTVTPGKGRAVCIGATFYGATSLRFLNGIRSFSGVASFVTPGGVPLPITPSVMPEVVGGGGALGRSGVFADWPDSAPIGPYEFDVSFALVAENAHGAGADRSIWLFEYKTGAPAADELREMVNGTVSNASAFSLIPFVVRGLKVARVPGDRSKRTGFFAFCQVYYGSGGGGAGLVPIASAHTASLVGYRWPNGPIAA